MNVGKMITDACREQRKRDAVRFRWSKYGNVFGAWWMWGWSINGRGGLGYPGQDYGDLMPSHRPVLVAHYGLFGAPFSKETLLPGASDCPLCARKLCVSSPEHKVHTFTAQSERCAAVCEGCASCVSSVHLPGDKVHETAATAGSS